MLVYQLEDILGANSDVVEEDDRGGGCVLRRVGHGGVEEGLDGEVAELGELVDAVAFLGVEGAAAEVVGCVEGGKEGLEGGEDLGGAVVGVAFDDGEGPVRGAEEADGFDDAADEAREEGEALAQVEGEEVLDGGVG